MSSPHLTEPDTGDTAEPGEYHDAYTGPDPLFAGDTGQLSLEVRQTYVTLLKKRYISAERHPRDWQVLLANEPALRTRLNDMFLDLIVDRGYEFAYKKQAISETGNRFPTVLHDIAYSREETIVLVHLRRLIRSSQKAGDDAVFVDKADLMEEVANYRPRSVTNHVASDKAAENAVASLVKAELLLKTPDEDRYRIAPVIEALLPVDRIKELHEWLVEQNTCDSRDPSLDLPNRAGDDADQEDGGVFADDEDADDAAEEQIR